MALTPAVLYRDLVCSHARASRVRVHRYFTGGTTLRRRSIPRRLSEGRAWGVARAMASGCSYLPRAVEAADAIERELTLRRRRSNAASRSEVAERPNVETNLLAIFAHYARDHRPAHAPDQARARSWS
jgi:hypothetical protein